MILDLSFCDGQFLSEATLVHQACEDCGGNDVAGRDIRWVMYAADETIVSKIIRSAQDRGGSIRKHLRQCKRLKIADHGVAAGIGVRGGPIAHRGKGRVRTEGPRTVKELFQFGVDGCRLLSQAQRKLRGVRKVRGDKVRSKYGPEGEDRLIVIVSLRSQHLGRSTAGLQAMELHQILVSLERAGRGRRGNERSIKQRAVSFVV